MRGIVFKRATSSKDLEKDAQYSFSYRDRFNGYRREHGQFGAGLRFRLPVLPSRPQCRHSRRLFLSILCPMHGYRVGPCTHLQH
jgi:hypothetical protein